MGEGTVTHLAYPRGNYLLLNTGKETRSMPRMSSRSLVAPSARVPAGRRLLALESGSVGEWSRSRLFDHAWQGADFGM
jgi:hypothetical protein